MTAEQQALYLNAIPLLALGTVYLVAAASLVPEVVRARRSARDVDLALALVFPCLGAAALVLGMLVLRDGEPIGGSGWPGLAAIAVALVPALAFFAGFRERALRVTAAGRVRVAEQRIRLRDAASLEEAARELADRAAAAAHVEFAALLLVEPDGRDGRGVLARENGVDVDWFPSVRLDLEREPSGVASAYHDAAPLTVYDARASQRVSARLVERTGARSVAFVPLIDEQRVIAVLVLAAIARQRVFSTDEIARLTALAAEAAPVVSRLRGVPSSDRAALVAGLATLVRESTNADDVLALAMKQVARALPADRCFVRLGEPGRPLSIKAQWQPAEFERIDDSQVSRLAVSDLAARERRTIVIGDVATAPELKEAADGGRRGLLELGSRAVLAVPLVAFGRVVGTLAAHRNAPGEWRNEDVAFLESVARELAFGLHTSQLLAENAQRLERQAALLAAAQSLTSELLFEGVLARLVKEVVALVGADAADCWLFDDRRRVLHCRAVHGLPATDLGRETAADGTIGRAVATRRPVLTRDFARTEQPPPSESYRGFEEVMDAPIIVQDEVRGVLGVCSRVAGRFGDDDLELLEAFATLASLALQNAEAFEERSRQAQIQRGFYRIASVLAEPLALPATLAALAQAAGEAFGAAFAAVVAGRNESFRVLGEHGVPAELLAAIEEVDAQGDRALELAADERRILASTTVADDDRFPARWRALARKGVFSSLLVVPIEAGEGTTGLVLVFFSSEWTATDEDLELAWHLAGAGRAALERSKVFEAERTSRSLAQQLARSGSVVASELDPAAVLDEVVEQAPALLEAEACAIRVTDGDELLVTAVSGEGTEGALGARSGSVGWLSGEVVQSRRPVAIEDAASDPALVAADAMLSAGYTAYLGVPLVGPEGSMHGVLSLYGRTRRAWRDEEVEALLALAANTSAALSNAELYQRVALERERNAAILDNIADGIVALDRDGDVVLWNRATEQVTGVPAAEALGRTPERVLGRPLRAGPSVPFSRGGADVWLSVTEAVMRDPAGRVAGRIFALRDVSSERLVEEMKSAFVSSVSHELRGPLTSIYGFAHTLLRDDVTFGEDERKAFVGYIAKESARLTKIVDRLLNVAHLETGDLRVELAPTDVRSLVREVVSSTTGTDGERKHDFVLELPPEPLAAEADPEKLRQVLAHLLENAVRYSPGGGKVTIAARRKSDSIEFQVADEGVGISSSERERIFRKFYADRERGGMGIGLYIAQGLVTAMGGRIRVESDEGEGSRFAFELPAARV